jgi:hypothetical protein
VQAWRSRSLLIALLATCYSVFAALRESPSAGPGWLGFLLLPIGLVAAWIGTAPPTRGLDPIEGAVRRAARVAATGTALLLAAWSGPAGRPLLEMTASIGAALAGISALVALARIAPRPGLLQPPRATRRLDAVALASLLWGVGVIVPAARVIAPERTTLLDPLAINYATLAAAAGTTGLIGAAALRVRAMRRLELGVADRASAALALTWVAVALAIPCALLGIAPADRVMMITAICAAASVFFACLSMEPTGVARTMRTVLAITILGTPVVMGGMAIGLRMPRAAGLSMLIMASACILVGLTARALAAPLGPARSRWLEAINKANEAALNPDPDGAVHDALATVRTLLPSDSAAPALFRCSPAEMLTIDRAGYVHVSPGEAPAHLYEIANGEPERTVRAEVLRALQVRRPDLRPLLTWFETRGLLATTLVRDDEGPVGLIALPRAARRAPMNLEEVRALRVLADRVGAVLGVSSALARSRARELELRKLADRRGDEIDRLKHRLTVEAVRHKAVAERLAQPAVATAYSPAARMALEYCERAGRLGSPLTLLAPSGVDPAPWAAASHLASPRQSRALIVVCADHPSEQTLDRWRDPELSPLVLAESGTLVVLELQALPRSAQDFLAASLSQRVSPSGAASPLDVALIVSVNATVDALVAAGRVSAPLADWLGDRAVALPALVSRAEDIRALALDHLARLGVRMRGDPLGIDERALAALIEHDWPGNDIEFGDVLLRCAGAAQGPRITAEDLASIGFVPRSFQLASQRTASKPPARSVSRPPEWGVEGASGRKPRARG